ncbi:U5 small nuclear ribonucleoprotein TSSC4 [Denticeps clupeoides]|uniref:U5 small nuclear ribonucleoprotein TSSC4 n=1 Tax=Denticeps clupeoides TaxID=299321 RepID=UPI0010A44DF5|nr:protein TSSC4 [Denticeps clupeoides]XP_028812604.1 protein TSSC4 [Denticeps clupeoides]XP_028812605.1 protein TSSC4 [Denticeps clupeoides]XP_028812606.1 protein TSSC4 [Denticeps clupeoides]
MCERADGAAETLSNRDAVKLQDELSLSDSDPEETIEALGPKVEDLSSSSGDEDGQDNQSHTATGGPAFLLQGGSMGFSYRSKNIFDNLESSAKLKSSHLSEDNVLDGPFARPAPPSPPMLDGGKKSESSVAKKPSTGKGVPDYLTNPERWTRYSLEDVEETSDQRNRQVAFQFLQDIQKQKLSLGPQDRPLTRTFNQEHGSQDKHKILFSKPSQGTKEEDVGSSKPSREKKAEVGLFHLDEAPWEEDDGKSAPSLRQRPPEEKRKINSASDDETEDAGEEGEKPAGVAFKSGSRKTNRKHFRRTVEADEDD